MNNVYWWTASTIHCISSDIRYKSNSGLYSFASIIFLSTRAVIFYCCNSFLYFQMLVILTKSVNRCFEKNPKFDMTPLLGGTDDVFSSLIHAFSW